MLSFENIPVTDDFLEELGRFVVIDSLTNFQTDVGYFLTAKGMQKFLGEKKLAQFRCRVTKNNREVISDELLLSVAGNFTLSPNFGPHRCLKITDAYLEEIKRNPAIRRIYIRNIETSFKMKTIYELIKHVFTQPERYFNWELGIIECREEDRKYLVEMQKIRNAYARSENDYYKFVRKEHVRDYDRPMFTWSPYSITFKCKFIP